MGRLRKWQQFLDRTPAEGLGPEARQGLYGELRFLSVLMANSTGLRGAVDAWVGPLAGIQDFQFSACSVEVKTSSARTHQTMEIANERQLDTTTVPDLFIFHLSLDERHGGGETLPGLVAEIRSLLANEPLASEVFEGRLLDAGYLDVHAAQYLETGFAIREASYFRVSDDFPRIVEAELKPGVGSVRYSVILAECMRFRVDESTVMAVISGANP